MSILASKDAATSYNTMDVSDTSYDSKRGRCHSIAKIEFDSRHGDAENQARLCPLRGRDTPVYMFLWLLCGLNIIAFATRIWKIRALVVGYSLVVSSLISFFSVRRSIAWCVYSVACFVVTGIGVFIGLLFQSEFVSVWHLTLVVVIALAELLFILIVLSRLVPLCFGSVVGSSAAWADKEGWGWQPEMLQYMKFGWACRHFLDVSMISDTWLFSAREYPKRLRQDVLKCRSYWSGEVALDYIFMLCNEHDWLHVIFCFPGHGLNRAESLALVLMLASTALFAAAAFSTVIHSSGLRLCVVFVMVTLPRAMMRKRLLNIAVADENLDLTGSHMDKRWGSGKWRFIVRKTLIKRNLPYAAWQKAAEIQSKRNTRETIYCCYLKTFALVLAFLGVCVVVIVARGYPLGQSLVGNIDVMAYMFVIRLWMQILILFGEDRGRGRDGGTFVGFFHYWYYQHTQYGSLLPRGIYTLPKDRQSDDESGEVSAVMTIAHEVSAV